jgi:uroporphyrinogen decarboxylase
MDRAVADILRERVSVTPPHRPRNDLVLRAMRGERTERTPVWLMRQAGRFDPEYRRLRERVGLELEQLFAHPALAAEITALPVRFGVDAAILFQDILTPLAPMGAPFRFRPGPVLERPVRTPADADRLRDFEPRVDLAFVADSIGLALGRLGGEVPLLGFAGAPLTLLSFLIEGGSPGSDSPAVRSFLRDHPDAAERLLSRIAALTADYLRMQIDAGVHAVQLFESCASLFSTEEHKRFALPFQRQIFGAIADTGVPRVIFAKDAAPVAMAASGADVVSIGAGFSLGAARGAAPGHALQGNVDNLLLRDGTPRQVREASQRCIREGGGRGHVLNLGHGVLQGTPVENVQAMIDASQECDPHAHPPQQEDSP